MRSPKSFSNSSNAWGLKAALPATYRRKGSGDSSRVFASRSNLAYIVGTPKNIVNEPSSSASYTLAASKLRCSSALAPEKNVPCAPTIKPCVWKSGRVRSRWLSAVQRQASQMDSVLATRFRCSSIAPLLRPVGETKSSPGVMEDGPPPPPPVRSVHRHDHTARQVRTQVRRQEIQAVAEKERDTLACVKAPGSERGGKGCGSRAQLLEAPLLALEKEARLLRRAFGVPDKSFDDRRRTISHYPFGINRR